LGSAGCARLLAFERFFVPTSVVELVAAVLVVVQG